MDGSKSGSARAREAAIARLAAPPAIGSLSMAGVRAVMAFRILAVCGSASREPLAELSCRLGSLTAAKAFMLLAERVSRAWPEPVLLARPCCALLTPDEATLAAMINAAAAGDRAGFEHVLAGFVRQERHSSLFDAAVAAIGEADVEGPLG